jgi:PAS domain S-box-containing protein
MFISLFAVVTTASMGVFLYHNISVPKARRSVAFLCSSSAIWLFAEAMKATGPSYGAMIFWEKIRFVGVLTLPVAWILFISRYTGNDSWISKKSLIALSVIPTISMLLLVTNSQHYLFWESVSVSMSATSCVLLSVKGPAYWVQLAFSYTLLGIGTFLLVRMFTQSNRLWRPQMILLGTTAFLGWGFNILEEIGIIDIFPLDPTAMVMSIMLPTMAFVVRKLRSIAVLPATRGAIIDGMQDGVIVLDSKGKLVYINTAAETLFDHNSSGKIEDSIERVWPGLWEILANLPGDAELTNEVIVYRGNEEYTYDVRISPVRDWSDQVLSRLMVIRDISVRKRAEARVLESEERYRLLAKNSTDVITRHDPHGSFLYVSPACLATLGYEPDALIGQSMFDYVHDDDREDVLKAHVRILCEPRTHTISYRLRRKDGEYIWVETSSRTIYAAGRDGGGPNEIVSVSRDITERKFAEDALLSERERLLVTLESIGDGVLALDSKSCVVLANTKAQEHLSVLANAGIGEELTQLGNRSLDSFLLAPPRGEACHEVKVTDPTPRVFEVVAQPMGNGSKSSGWVLVTRDITDERETLRRVQLQDRLAAVGQLAAGIAHDFNNIIGAIILYSEMVLQTPDLGEKNVERLTTIFQQAGRAATLTHQILDFSRRTVMDQAPMDLISFLKETEKLLSRTLRENLQLKLNCVDTNCVISADPTRIQQIIMNLAFNAQDAMPKGGDLCFDLSCIRVEEGELAPYRDMEPGAWIRLKVSDTGVGMPPEITQHIFEPFFTTKEPGAGSGLGLAQVYGIVKQHGGYIDVESQVGQGSTFIIYFPALEVPVEATPMLPGKLSISGQQEQILVVEDDEATLNAVFEILETLNYRVFTARDGLQALEIIERENGSIDLILSDLVLPEMGGVALYRELENRNIDTKIVFMTGYPLGTGTKELLDYNKVTWIQKPIRSETLAEVIHEAINGKN